MSEIVYHSEIKGLNEFLRDLNGKGVQVGLRRGMKKVGAGVKTRAVRAIRENYLLKKGDVDKTFSITASGASVTISSKSRAVNLTYFGAKQLGSVGGKRVTVSRKGDNIKRSVRGKAGAFGGVTVPIETSHTTLMPGAFIAKVKAGNKGGFSVGVFSRIDKPGRSQYKDPRNRRKTDRPYVKKVRAANPKPRAAIINRAFVSVPTLFGGKRVMPVIDEYLNNDALKTIQHEIEFALNNGG